MNLRCQLAATVLMAFASQVPIAAAAEPLATPASNQSSEALAEQARHLFLEGVDHYRNRDWQRAYASFLAAWAVVKHWDIAGNLGDVELKLGRYRDAAEHLAYDLREQPKGEKDRAHVQAMLDDARAHVSTLDVKVNIDGADIVLDGMRAGVSPLAAPLFVEPGHHVIEASVKGPVVAKQALDVGAGASQSVTLNIGATAAGVAALFGGRAGAGGGGAGVGPAAGADPSAGRDAAPADAAAAGTTRDTLPLVIAGIAAGVGVAVGVGFIVAANGKSSTREDALAGLHATKPDEACVSNAYSPDCQQIRSLRDDEKIFRTVGVTGLVVAGVSAGVGVAYYFLSRPTNQRAGVQASGVTVAPWATLGGAGAAVAGAF